MTDTPFPPPTHFSTMLPSNLATKLSYALLGFAIVWWFIYYAQVEGAFGLMSQKITCLDDVPRDCAQLQARIQGRIPIYSPVVWWAGVGAFVLGFLQSQWRNKSRG